MKKLILSKEVYDAEWDLNFRLHNLYRFANQPNYLTDGEMVIDIRKNPIDTKDYYIKELEEYKFDAVVKPYIEENYLKEVLQIKNMVSLSDITYKDNGLLRNCNGDHLIGAYYANELKGLELFYYKDKIYFFVINEADENMGINFDSFMFIGFVCGCREESPFTKECLRILQDLQYYLTDII